MLFDFLYGILLRDKPSVVKGNGLLTENLKITASKTEHIICKIIFPCLGDILKAEVPLADDSSYTAVSNMLTPGDKELLLLIGVKSEYRQTDALLTKVDEKVGALILKNCHILFRQKFCLVCRAREKSCFFIHNNCPAERNFGSSGIIEKTLTQLPCYQLAKACSVVRILAAEAALITVTEDIITAA